MAGRANCATLECNSADEWGFATYLGEGIVGKLAFIVLLFGLAGCASAPPPATASGQPDVVLTNVDVACVRASLMEGMVNNGFQIAQSTDSMIVGKRPTRNTMASVLLSTRMSGPPEERVTLTMINSAPDTVRVIAYMAYVSNAGTAFEQQTPVQATQANQDEFAASARNTRCKKSA
jgi:hypothetical protein